MLHYPEDLMNIPCPIEKTITLIGNKWTLLLIREFYLSNGPLRFNDLLKSLKPISSKTLSSKLKDLVLYGIIERNVENTMPIKVEYFLTEKGKDLRSVLLSMAEWSKRWHSF
jgi:DNA-binding HxlR family transcriptional regulator